MAIANGILEGAIMAVIYLPFLAMLYRICFNKHDQHRIRQCANMIEATISVTIIINIEDIFMYLIHMKL